MGSNTSIKSNNKRLLNDKTTSTNLDVSYALTKNTNHILSPVLNIYKKGIFIGKLGHGNEFCNRNRDVMVEIVLSS